jgi:hypothetical protein
VHKMRKWPLGDNEPPACPPDRPVRTPEGCFAYPSGDEPPSNASLPAWVLPAAIGGAALIAVVAIVASGPTMTPNARRKRRKTR